MRTTIVGKGRGNRRRLHRYESVISTVVYGFIKHCGFDHDKFTISLVGSNRANEFKDNDSLKLKGAGPGGSYYAEAVVGLGHDAVLIHIQEHKDGKHSWPGNELFTRLDAHTSNHIWCLPVVRNGSKPLPQQQLIGGVTRVSAPVSVRDGTEPSITVDEQVSNAGIAEPAPMIVALSSAPAKVPLIDPGAMYSLVCAMAIEFDGCRKAFGCGQLQKLIAQCNIRNPIRVVVHMLKTRGFMVEEKKEYDKQFRRKIPSYRLTEAAVNFADKPAPEKPVLTRKKAEKLAKVSRQTPTHTGGPVDALVFANPPDGSGCAVSEAPAGPPAPPANPPPEIKLVPPLSPPPAPKAEKSDPEFTEVEWQGLIRLHPDLGKLSGLIAQESSLLAQLAEVRYVLKEPDMVNARASLPALRTVLDNLATV